MTSSDRADSPSEAELRQRIAQGSQELDDYRQLANLLGDAERWDEAAGLLQHALELDLEDVERARLCAELGWFSYERGQLGRGLELGRKAASLVLDRPDDPFPEDPLTLFLRGSSQSLLAHCLWRTDTAAGTEAARAALDHFERLLAGAHDSEWTTQSYVEAARLHNMLPEGAKAIDLCQRYLQQDLPVGEQLDGFSVLAEAFRLAGRLSEAEETVNEALRLATGRRFELPLLYQTRGLVQRAAGRRADAEGSFELALAALAEAHPWWRDDPEWLKTIYGNLGELYYEGEDYGKAAAAFERLLALYPGDQARWLLMSLGDCHYGARDYARARDCYEMAANSTSASEEERAEARVWIESSLARLRYDEGKFVEAAEAFQRLLRYYPEDDADRRRVLGWLGDCHFSMGAYAQARACYEDVLTSSRASEEEKVRVRPIALRSAGRVSFESGQYADAAMMFQRVLSGAEEDDFYRAADLLWLAACYRAIGAPSAARDCYEEVLNLPRATEADKVSARKDLASLVGTSIVNVARRRAHMPEGTSGILNARSLEASHRRLAALLEPGMHVLDVGCGTGAITRGIAAAVGQSGQVIGVDVNPGLVAEARAAHSGVAGLSFEVADVLSLPFHDAFDIVTAARVLQWLADPQAAVAAMRRATRPGGRVVVLDYNHERIGWTPDPPASMQALYAAFLRWRADAGMDNAIADHLAGLFAAAGLADIAVRPQHEETRRDDPDFETRAAIWAEVAATRGHQMVADGVISESARASAETDCRSWVRDQAEAQTLYLLAVEGVRPAREAAS